MEIGKIQNDGWIFFSITTYCYYYCFCCCFCCCCCYYYYSFVVVFFKEIWQGSQSFVRCNIGLSVE